MVNTNFSPKYEIEVKPQGLNMLYSRCNFLKQFMLNPSMARRDEWIAAGTILLNLGSTGANEWEKLSKIDTVNWDNLEFISTLSDIKSKVIPEYTCKDISRQFGSLCNSCPDYNSPKDILLKYAADRKHGTISSNIQPLSSKTARQTLQSEIKVLFANLAAEVYHVGPPNGVGKTTSIINELPTIIKGQTGPKKVLFLVPRHNLAEEVERKMRNYYRGQRISIVRLMSRERLQESGKINCPYDAKLIKIYNVFRYPVNDLLCKNCNSAKTCEYWKRIKRAAKSNIVIGVHAHMQYKFVFDLVKPDVIIIDECFVNSYRKEVTFKDKDISFTEHVIKNASLPAKIQQDILNSLSNLKKGNVPQWQKDYSTKNSITAKLAESINNIGIQGVLLFNDLAYLTRNSMSVKRENNYYKYIKTAEIPDNIPMIILDSTTTHSHYQALLGRNVKPVSLPNNTNIKHYVEVTQILDGAYPISSLYNKAQDTLTDSAIRLLRLMATILSGIKWNIITHEPLSAHIKKHLYNLTKGGLVTYFGNVSGLNVLENADVITVLGFKMLGYANLVDVARVIFNTGWDDNAVNNQVQQAAKDANNPSMECLSFHDDNLCFKVPVKKYSNRFVQFTSDIIEHGDFIQALGRIRPFEAKKPTQKSGLKHRQLYIICNQPTGPVPVDKALTINKLGQQYIFPKTNEQRDTLKALVELLRTSGIPDKNIASEVAKKARDIGLFLKPSTVRNQLKRNGVDAFVNTAKALLANDSLQTLMFNPNYSKMSRKDILKQRITEYFASQDESNNDKDEELPSAELLEIISQLLDEKSDKLKHLIDDPQFSKLPYEERIKRLRSIINEPIDLGEYNIGMGTFNDLINEEKAFDDDDDDPIS